MAKNDPTVGETLRILSVVTRFGAGGPPISVLRDARGLESYGYETTIAAGSCSAQDGDMSYLLNERDRVEWIPAMSREVSPGADFVALFHLIRLIRRYRPDIVHTHTAKAGVLGRVAGWLTGTPLIVHTFHGNVLRGYFSVFGSWCVRKIEQAMALISDAVLVLSPQQRKEIAEDCGIGGPDKVHIVPLGVALDAFADLAPPPASRSELIVAWFGRLVAVKNVPLLVNVVEETLRTLPGVRFIIAGDGPDRTSVKPLADKFPGRVEFLGWVKDVAPIMARCDVLLQTSLNEGTPTALIQGMAAARPFISTAVGGVSDMVAGSPRSDGKARWFSNAVLVPLEFPPIVAALKAFTRDRSLLLKMGLAARQMALERYSEKKVLKTTHELYVNKLAEKGRRVPARLREQIAEENAMGQELGRLAQQCGFKVETAAQAEANGK